ncbi:MAG: hypothetical protein ABSA90_11805 [Xanthobacteraceae bacterium]|jgi:hypothetical protein
MDDLTVRNRVCRRAALESRTDRSRARAHAREERLAIDPAAGSCRPTSPRASSCWRDHRRYADAEE